MLDALDIGYAIKDRRAQLGLTQAQVAEAAGVSKRCLWSLELGQNPGVQLNKLTAVLGVLGLDLTIGYGDLPSNPENECKSRKGESASEAPAVSSEVPSESGLSDADSTTSSPVGGKKSIDAFAILSGRGE